MKKTNKVKASKVKAKSKSVSSKKRPRCGKCKNPGHNARTCSKK